MNKRVLFVIDNLKTGGAEQVFTDIVHLMFGYIPLDVMLLLPCQSEEYVLPGEIKKFYLNRSNKWSLRSFLECRALIKQYTTIHVHMRHTYRYIAFVRMSIFFGPKLILHDHYGMIKVDKKPPFILFKLIKPDIYIGVCNELVFWARDVWGLKSSQVFALFNFPSQRFLDFKLKENQTLNDNINDMVMVGNIKNIKNQLFAAEVCSALKRRLTLIGKNQDNRYFLSLKNSTVCERVSFLEDITDVTKVLKSFKIALYTSISESGPLVIIEYLLCGLPFLAYKTGGTAEVVSRYFPEYFIDNFLVGEWVSRIALIEEKYMNISFEKVQLMLKNEFNKDNYRRTLLDIYEK